MARALWNAPLNFWAYNRSLFKAKKRTEWAEPTSEPHLLCMVRTPDSPTCRIPADKRRPTHTLEVGYHRHWTHQRWGTKYGCTEQVSISVRPQTKIPKQRYVKTFWFLTGPRNTAWSISFPSVSCYKERASIPLLELIKKQRTWVLFFFHLQIQETPTTFTSMWY